MLIADDDKGLFTRATQQVLADDSKSVRARFWLAIPSADQKSDISHADNSLESEPVVPREAIEVDANGILIHDRITGEPTHVSHSQSWLRSFLIFADHVGLHCCSGDQGLGSGRP